MQIICPKCHESYDCPTPIRENQKFICACGEKFSFDDQQKINDDEDDNSTPSCLSKLLQLCHIKKQEPSEDTATLNDIRDRLDTLIELMQWQKKHLEEQSQKIISPEKK